jgi:hypothetical protein
MSTNKAMRSFFGAREGGQDRPQDVFTPQFMIDAILKVWPEGIALDPCSHPDSIVPALSELTENGELTPWPDFTYVNPPYKHLIKWCPRFKAFRELMLLCPVRANRAWYAQASRETTMQCWLKPFSFLGYDQSFPAPLAMHYYGLRVSQFSEAFSTLGEIVRVL